MVLLSLPALAADPLAGDLPRLAQELRDKGLDADEVKQALMSAKEAKLSAGDASVMLQDSIGPVEQNGPVEKFGVFVKTKLDEGLRGRELAAAIKTEHENRGIGNGKGTPPAPATAPATAPGTKPATAPSAGPRTPPPAPSAGTRPGADPKPMARPGSVPASDPKPTTEEPGPRGKGKFRPGGR